jgi:hypothetical protein
MIRNSIPDQNFMFLFITVFPIVSATISELMLFQLNILNVREEIFKCLHKSISRNLTFVEFVYILLTGGPFLCTFVYTGVTPDWECTIVYRGRYSSGKSRT